ncbi:MAG: hypothetical protein ACRCY9_07115 [Phycicoccus sp.]
MTPRMGKPYTVIRSTTIDAAAGRIRPLINDFHEWPAWSPSEDVEPGMRRTYSGRRVLTTIEHKFRQRSDAEGGCDIVDFRQRLRTEQLKVRTSEVSDPREAWALVLVICRWPGGITGRRAVRCGFRSSEVGTA